MAATLPDRIHADMVAALKAQQKQKVSVLRMLLAALKEASIAQKGELDDADAMKVLQSYAKKRQEAQAEAEKAGREEHAAQEAAELEIVRAYLPEPLDDDALAALVTGAIEELGAGSMKDMGRVMKLCVERAEGRADGGRISAAVKKLLAG